MNPDLLNKSTIEQLLAIGAQYSFIEDDQQVGIGARLQL